MENRAQLDDERMCHLEDNLKQAQYIAEEREQSYDEVRRKRQQEKQQQK